MKKNPAVLKKSLYYLQRGEISYLLSKIKEKLKNNLSIIKTHFKIVPDKYFKQFNAEDYSLMETTIDIIIPVYNGFEFLTPLFDSIETNTISPFRLIVINDCSSDKRVKPYLKQRLEKFSKAIFIDLDINQGFVKSVNEACKYTKNHFIILNTNTEVPIFWVERLMYPIFSMNKVASTTPFTNAGQMASFPNFLVDNNIFEGMNVNELDGVFRNIRPDDFYTEVPTGVGFCMGVNYSLVEKIGFFDEEEFGKGYGEVNDWCQRAIQEGYKNLMVPNLFVYHKHGGSFPSKEKLDLMKKNSMKILKKYPNYEKSIESYIKKDPHKNLRYILILTACSKHEEGIHLIVDHALEGGTNTYSKNLKKRYTKERKKILHLVYDFYANTYKLYFNYNSYHFSFTITKLEELESFFVHIRLKEIFLNSLVSFQENYDVLTLIEKLTLGNGANLNIPIHDYYPICPNYTLLNSTGEFCEIPTLEKCKTCMKFNKLEWKKFFNSSTDVALWRAKWSSLFRIAHTIICFSHSSKILLLKAYNDIDQDKIKIIPHETPYLPVVHTEKTILKKTNTVIGVLGTISYAKGARVLKTLVEVIEERNLAIKIVLIGEITEHIESDHFYITGHYLREELPELVLEHKIDICLIPSICPETFSYTTQEIMMMQLPLMVFNLGAPAERVQEYEKGVVLDKDYVENIIQYVLK